MLKLLFLFFAFTFVLIQPSKILADLTGFKFITAQFLFPLCLYFILLLKWRKLKQIKLHAVVTLAQISIVILHYFMVDLTLNNYFLFFLITPHYFLFVKYLFEEKIDISPLFTFMAVYIIGITFLSVFTILTRSDGVGPGTLFSALGPDLMTRQDTTARTQILESVNFAHYLFGANKSTLEGVALTIFPLTFLSLLFADIGQIKNKLVFTGAVCSLIMIIFKSSRAEILYFFLLAGYPIAQKLFARAKWLSLLILGFGYIQLLLSDVVLNGRGTLNRFFLDSVSLLGKGVGYSSKKILEITDGDTSSFHNLHFELITNFGLIVYFCLIAFTVYFILKGQYNRYKHLYLCLFFFLLATNFEFFDIYFYVPLALLFTKSSQLAPKV